MKVTYIESPEGMWHDGLEWEKLQHQILAEKPDVLITNEMPFGHGLAASDEYDATAAGESISAHTLRGRCIEAAWYPTRAFISTDSFGR